MPAPLQQRELLRYHGSGITQPVFDCEWNTIGRLNDGDVVIVMQDQINQHIKIMLPSGKIGWTFMTEHRLLNPKHAVGLFVDEL